MEVKVVTICTECDAMYEGSLLFQKCIKCGNPMSLVVDAKSIMEALEDED